MKPKLTDWRPGCILVRLSKNVRIDSFYVTSSWDQDLSLKKKSSISYFLIIKVIMCIVKYLENTEEYEKENPYRKPLLTFCVLA